ncbi:MAG: hypothetical protein DMF53_00510 [Acidobacteria bacterium]|nr:MAG: hypothetical protein DMF53_00510 [Acidobacteriota bacterium]
MAAKIVSGAAGSAARSTAPVLSSTNRTFSQLRPPSVLRNTPRSALGPKTCPWAATSTTSAFLGSIHRRPMWRLSASPRGSQVLPPSAER